MIRVRCPQKRCSFWLNGWCDADEIELDPLSLSCMTFDEMELAEESSAAGNAEDDEDEEDLEWIDEESIFEDDMDESRYSLDDGDPEFADEEDDLSEEEDLWPL